MSGKSKQIVGLILIVIFALYYANICFFYHSHIINGSTIVHSHLHNKAHTQTGTHSGSELTLISALSAFQSLQAFASIVSPGIFIFLLAIILPVIEKKTDWNLTICIPLRAPPSLL